MTAPSATPMPCPFCGSKIATVLEEQRRVLFGITDVAFKVECSLIECRAGTNWWYPRSAAIAAWNRRAEVKP